METILFGSSLSKKKERLLSMAGGEFKKNDKNVIAIGNESEDFEILKNADIAIVFGDLKNVEPMLYEVCDYAIDNEGRLVDLLKRMRSGDD